MAAPEAVFSGCVDRMEGACILEHADTLTVWLDVHAATPLQVRIDGRAVPSTGRVVQGGVLLEVAVPEGVERVSVEPPSTRWTPPISLAIDWREWPPIEGLSNEQLKAFVEGHSGWAKLRALDALRRRNSLSASERVAAADAELELGRDLGLPRHQVNVLGVRAHDAIEVAHDHEEARAALRDLAALAKNSLLAQARWEYYGAILSRRTGDLGTALERLERSYAISEKLNYAIRDPLEHRASTLAELGRDEEALALYEQLEEDLWNDEVDCGEWVRVANNLAWIQLVLGGAGLEHNDPRLLLETALRRSSECPAYRAAILLDLAMAELDDQRPREALAWLSHMAPRDYPVWVEMIRTAASLEDWDVASQPPLISEPLPTPDVELAWNQRVRQGDLFSAWGFHALAVQAYRAAEDQLAATFERVGSDENGELYLAGRSSSLRGLVDALVELGRPTEASCAVRLARAREFARLDRHARGSTATAEQRAQWNRQLDVLIERQRAAANARRELWALSRAERALAQAHLEQRERENRALLDDAIRGLGLEPSPRTCDELRPPGNGEVILVGFERRVFALSTDGTQVTARDDLSALDSVADASHLTLIEAGRGERTPLHLLPWRSAGSLLDVAPVSYSLDLRPRPARLDSGRSALLVADPRGDLAQARAEADDVARALSANGWTITDLRGARAERLRVVESSAGADLLHFAGHGVRAGASGWDSALLLADDQRFGVHDVFMLAEVPRGIVLTGCETAAPSPNTVGGGMNIGRAFVLAGSEWVIAADARVDDDVAARVGAAIHRSEGESGPARLRDALLSLRSEAPELPWQQYRVITP